jgi:endonuclease-3 related protein
MQKLKSTILQLRKRYGNQCDWWPCIWPSKVPSRRAFEIAVGAILTQNTSWKNVEQALRSLTREKLVSPQAIASCREDRLARTIRSSGYYKQKAKKLKLFAQFVEKELRGNVLNLAKGRSLDQARARLLDLWGIGPETADTILLYALDQPIFVVDAYTRRLFVELSADPSWLKRHDDELREACEKAVPRRSRATWKEAHALIVAWGKEKQPRHKST